MKETTYFKQAELMLRILPLLIEKMDPSKHRKAVQKLKDYLGV
jgi:hypothetical protein